MELGLGTRLFTRYATTPDEAVILLEDAVTGDDGPGRDSSPVTPGPTRRRRPSRWSWS